MNESQKRTFTTLGFATLIAASAFFKHNLSFSPVPIVIQNMFPIFAGCMLGSIQGAASCGIVLALGMVGLPVFSGFTGGTLIIYGPTGGFLVGYFIAALIAGAIAGKPKSNHKHPVLRIFSAAIVGFLIIYITGSLHFIRYFELPLSKETFASVFEKCIKPFILGDCIKAAVVTILTISLKKYL
ncbi:MAG: biotin transporter BioY [Treponema sp.]|jgi:biotin transport system substrate-specific component|nr:biotin transporter BioY [Treponema sp.]